MVKIVYFVITLALLVLIASNMYIQAPKVLGQTESQGFRQALATAGILVAFILVAIFWYWWPMILPVLIWLLLAMGISSSTGQRLKQANLVSDILFYLLVLTEVCMALFAAVRRRKIEAE